MVTRRAALPLGVLFFLLVALIGPIGAGARSGLSCDDFANPDAAQVLLDLDDSHAGDLDPDGDGIACNEGGEERDDSSGYLDVIATEVETIEASFDEFFDVMLSYRDDMSSMEVVDISNQLNDFAAMWAEYPEIAPELDVPASHEDIDDTWQQWVALVGESGEGWQHYQEVVRDGTDADLQDALVAFDETQLAARDLGDTLLRMVDEAGVSTDDREHDDDDRDAESANDDLTADQYLEAVDEHFNVLVDSYQDFTDIIDTGEVTDDDRDTLFAIYDTWASAADVAATIEPPAGYEELHTAYLELADAFVDLYDIYAVWLETESGTEEDEEALAAFEEQVDVLNELCIAFDQMLTDAFS